MTMRSAIVLAPPARLRAEPHPPLAGRVRRRCRGPAPVRSAKGHRRVLEGAGRREAVGGRIEQKRAARHPVAGRLPDRVVLPPTDDEHPSVSQRDGRVVRAGRRKRSSSRVSPRTPGGGRARGGSARRSGRARGEGCTVRRPTSRPEARREPGPRRQARRVRPLRCAVVRARRPGDADVRGLRARG